MPVIKPRLPGIAGLQDTFWQFDLDFNATLIEGRADSEFNPALSAGFLDEIGFMTMDFDRRVFVNGHTDQQVFFVVNSGESWFKGDTIQPMCPETGYGAISGFRNDDNELAAQQEGKAQSIWLPQGAMEHYLEVIGAHSAIETMRRTSVLEISKALLADFTRLQSMGCNGTLQDKRSIYHMLMVALLVGRDYPDTIISKNWDRAMQAFNLAHEMAMGDPISVKELAQTMFVTEACINRASKEVFGCTIGRLLECARITQANIALTKSGATVKQVMHQYGFNDSRRFAKKHQELFGTPPKQQPAPLLEKNEGPGIPRLWKPGDYQARQSPKPDVVT